MRQFALITLLLALSACTAEEVKHSVSGTLSNVCKQNAGHCVDTDKNK